MKKLGKLKRIKTNTIEYFTCYCSCGCDCTCSCYSECFDACFGVQPEINTDFNFIGATNLAEEELTDLDNIDIEDRDDVYFT